MVLMNALHFSITFFPTADFSLNKIISYSKRFIAYEIIKWLKETNQTDILQQLENAVTAKEKSKGQKHKVFEESFDAKSLDNKKFFLQKPNYIHLNPCLPPGRLFAEIIGW